jgi:LysM repeat protein
MKRRTRLIAIGCATLGGTFTTGLAAEAAFAAPLAGAATIPKVTVQRGDSLSTIGVRTHRTWPQLAAYNRITNPDLIYAGQVLSIPPATYAPVPPASAGSTTYAAGATTVAPTTTAGAVASTPAAATAPPAGIWGCIASYESGGVASTNTGNGYYGMYQDTQSSWVSGGGLAYAPRADQASAAAQTIVNQRVQAQQGWGAWPVTSRMCGA